MQDFSTTSLSERRARIPVPRKVLMLGFSVTADTPGFVEIAAQRLGVSDRFILTKRAIGGVGLPSLRFILDDIVAGCDPDLVVIEIATNYLRGQPELPEYREYFWQLLGFFETRGLPVAVLDFPRDDMNPPESDWMSKLHAEFCAASNLPFRRVALGAAELRDGVHASASGQEIYADLLLDFLDEIPNPAVVPSVDLPTETGFPFAAPRLSNLPDLPLECQSFARSGYTVEMAQLPEGESVTLNVPEGHVLRGFSCLKGPCGGWLRLQIEGQDDRRFLAYDQWSYYERLAFWQFPPIAATKVTLSQEPGIPDVVLLKGEKSHAPRIGKIGHMLIERSEQPDSAADETDVSQKARDLTRDTA